jgi:sensor c-di-GMP phosphodiesterase-like protein
VAAADLSDRGFLSMLEKALKRSGVATRSLALEITESSTARNNTAIETIRVLRQRGHRVYIDDFGTGYSSLSYLHALSIDAIKIDKSFIQTIGTEAVTGCILPQILSIAKELSLEVILEGIETQEQLDHFSNAGQNLFAQGWLFGFPVPAAEFQRRLTSD